MSDKPVPVPTPESQPFWDATAQGRLIYQFCLACSTAQYYPRILCSHCGERNLEWRESDRQGTIHAVTQVHIGLPSFKADAPYSIVLVDMDEGFRMLVTALNADVSIGDRGTIGFEPRRDISLPQFQTICETMV